MEFKTARTSTACCVNGGRVMLAVCLVPFWRKISYMFFEIVVMLQVFGSIWLVQNF